jgi:hypothetical protein
MSAVLSGLSVNGKLIAVTSLSNEECILNKLKISKGLVHYGSNNFIEA